MYRNIKLLPILLVGFLIGCTPPSKSLNQKGKIKTSSVVKYSYTDTNKPITLLLANASFQAYQVFNKDKPEECQQVSIEQLPNYEFVECWKGNSFINTRSPKTEIAGAVFRTKSAPYTYIFAFRGTSTKADAVSDIRTRKIPFSSMNKNIHINNNIRVHNGFFSNYANDSRRHNMESMRDQLFKIIDKYQRSEKPINELLITGHSLGAALSTLFTLDVALVHPQISTKAINFASPKVGNRHFVKFYQQQTKQIETLRVVNSFDFVPCTPKLAYEHTEKSYLLGFYENEKKTKRKGVHTMLNYAQVLNCANQSKSGVCSQIIDINSEGDVIQIHSEKGSMKNLCKTVR